MWDEAMEIMKPNLRIHEMMTNNKSAVDSTVVKQKAKEIYSHFTLGQKMLKLLGQCWLTRTFQKVIQLEK